MAKVGKPLKYQPEELQAVINNYFAVTPKEEYTVTGLALMVGGKQLVQDYQERKGYSEMVKLAKLRVENSYELSLRKNGKAGDIFGLKNFGWVDRQEIGVDTLTLEQKLRMLEQQRIERHETD